MQAGRQALLELGGRLGVLEREGIQVLGRAELELVHLVVPLLGLLVAGLARGSGRSSLLLGLGHRGLDTGSGGVLPPRNRDELFDLGDLLRLSRRE